MKKRFYIAGLILVSSLATGQDKVVKLEESVITSENTETTIADIPKNITVLTGEEITQRGAKTVAEALKLVSSVIVKEMGGADAAFDIRGQGPTAKSNVIVLVDGAPINSIDLSGYQTSNIPVDNIERIEVIPSGGSVLYGDGAVGGTINIVTKAPENKKNYGSLNSEIGSYGLKKQQITYGTKIGEKLLVEVDYLKREKDGYRDYSKDNLESFGFRSRYKLNDGELKFKYNYSKNEFKAPGWLFGSEVSDDRTQSNSKRWRVDGKTEKNNFMGDYLYNINSDLEFKLLGRYAHENYSSNGSNYKTEIKYLKPQLRYSYLNENYIVFGGDVYAGETKSYSSYGDSKAEKNSLGGFIVNSYTIDNFRFTQGYRRQNIEYKGKNKNFSEKKFKEDAIELTGSYLYSDSGSTYISYTKGFRAPNTDEINVWDGEFNTQKTETYEIGAKDFVGNTYISTSVFYIETENEIFYGVNKNDEVNKNRNLDGTSKRKGIEFSMEHYFDKLTISESITYMKTEFKERKDIPGVPNIKGVLNFNYKFNEKLSFNNSWEYYGKAYDNDDEANEREKTDSYILSGLTFIYDFKDGLVINAGINNLFNEKYYDYVGYKKPSEQDPTFGKTYYPAPERNYYIGFKYSF
ncbi:TonB-dependent receptor [Cetobacterium somerae]|uniref:TonB-dependent receptor n=1 Tax=Cetobacterium somerae TaxID=188913 RepID=UPI001F060903|nr:TonB-dependent receptor [Cetobacterium somerae]UPO97698.1 TonB-dependent receptor [Cetobacterium somerae]